MPGRPATSQLLPTLPDIADPWPLRLALAMGIACTVGLFAWSNPLSFDREARWRQLLGGDQALLGLTYEFAGPSPFGPERLQGAAPLAPIELRNRFHGTAPAGPEFTGVVLSSPFVLTKPWLIVPYAGYPAVAGNGLRLRLVDAKGAQVGDEIGCPGPNQDGVSYWAVDVTKHVGARARLVLYDGRNAQEGWIAVAPPVPAGSAELASQLAVRLQRETQGRLHTSLAIIALVSYLAACMAWRSSRSRGPVGV